MRHTLHICTLVIYQDIPKKQIPVTIFLSGTDDKFWCEKYSREETIQGWKLYEEIQYYSFISKVDS